MDNEDEQTLILQAKTGDADAWDVIVHLYEGSLHNHIRRSCSRLPVHLSTEDILQETLLRAWLKIGAIRHTQRLRFFCWLKSVANRQLLDTLKAERRLKRGGSQSRSVSFARSSGVDNDFFDQLSDETHGVHSLFASTEAVGELRSALERLPPAQRKACRLRYLEEKSTDQTAAEMQCTVGAVRGLLRRGKRRLACELRSKSKNGSPRLVGIEKRKKVRASE